MQFTPNEMIPNYLPPARMIELPTQQAHFVLTTIDTGTRKYRRVDKQDAEVVDDPVAAKCAPPP